MSRRFATHVLAELAVLVLVTGHALCQAESVPVISGIYPPSATIGGLTDWTITGRNLTKVKTLLISGGGLEVVELSVKNETTAVAKVRVPIGTEADYREVRVDGSTGVSNLVLVRVDRLPQQLEVEPNDLESNAQEIPEGSSVSGVLKPLDIDYYRVKGTPGRRLTLDLETRRVGNTIAPVMTVFSANGRAIAQGRESRGSDRDCRMTIALPADGVCLVQVRDNLYSGGDQANYRLRVDSAPYASGLFPLGGVRGQTIEVEVSGGNLTEPRRKSVKLPDSSGRFVDPGAFDGPGGASPSPSRLLVGEGPEVTEPANRLEGSAFEISTNVTVNARISRSGEVDLYRIPVKAGETVRVRVQAASLGSWLDSVATLRDDKGVTLAENDDSNNAFAPDQDRAVNAVGIPDRTPDSALAYDVKADGVLTLEIADRFGDGGPEYGYRLAVGTARPDYSVTLLLGNANVNAQTIANLGSVKRARTTPGQFGVFNLKPATSTPINFLVVPDGRPGSVEVSIEGLPEGVTADPVRVRMGGPPAPGSTSAMPADASAVADFLLLKVSPYAQPGLGEIRIVAKSELPGVPRSREASATIGIDSSGTSGRPITRAINRFLIRILGEPRPLFVGPPSPPTLRKVSVPGPMLQGDQLDLVIDFKGAISPDDGSTLEAVAEGVGLATNTVISAGTSLTEDESSSDVVIHVLASIKAELGPHRVRVSYTSGSGSTVTREATIEVKCPIEVRAPADSIFLRPGDSATVPVEIRREAGFDGEVELKLEGLPRGVKLAKGVTFNAGVTKADVVLEMSAEARPIAKPSELRVIGMARMPRGNVSVESKSRAMILPRPADNGKET